MGQFTLALVQRGLEVVSQGVSQWRGAGEGLEGTQRLPSWGEAGSQNWRRSLLHGNSDSLGALGWGPGICVFSSSFLLLPLR